MRQPIPLRVFQSPAAAERERDTSRPVMLVGFQHQGNLGLGYLAAVLREHGYSVRVVDIEQPPSEILRIAQEINPILIGFSRMYIGAHYLSDVVCAAVLGLACALLVTHFFLRPIENRQSSIEN